MIIYRSFSQKIFYGANNLIDYDIKISLLQYYIILPYYHTLFITSNYSVTEILFITFMIT
ncbi:hypothetical protein RhiirC2_758984 [Rhizophagus irregularis]|uniref:Uncharacterized protein n=1 Tax=Rhizophagus irregularis TaxID=588596 RepID=A0A2N1MMS8_9GLOM|nr:hypothetical protein RhiirC2_758984 [Rhizophagus irregularis]